MKRINIALWWSQTTLLYKTFTKRLRLIKVNRELLVFLVFFCIAVIFWFLQALQENASMKIEYQLKIHNIPDKIIITSEIPKEVTATIGGRGYDILDYITNNNDRTIDVDFSELIRTDITLSIDNNLWRRLLIKEIGSTLRQVTTTPPTLLLSYSNGQKKRVPVIYAGMCSTGEQYSLRHTTITPDSVDVYAPINMYDTITSIHTEKRVYQDLERSFTTQIPLAPAEGVKVIPETVNVHFHIELFTEKTVKVPIYCENTPSNKIVRTFPTHTSVTFRVSATNFNNITADDFLVTTDYNQLNASTKSCQLQISSQPAEVSHIRMSPSAVEYVIEKRN